ncbi:MAG: hypothetical protein ACHREM_29590, partial [Polyangiales bacterium]
MTTTRVALRLLVILILACAARRAEAETIGAPIGGKVVSIGLDRIVCGVLDGGWTVDADGRSLHPPTREESIGRRVDVTVAKSADDCVAHGARVTLVATGPLPAIEASSASLLLD